MMKLRSMLLHATSLEEMWKQFSTLWPRTSGNISLSSIIISTIWNPAPDMSGGLPRYGLRSPTLPSPTYLPWWLQSCIVRNWTERSGKNEGKSERSAADKRNKVEGSGLHPVVIHPQINRTIIVSSNSSIVRLSKPHLLSLPQCITTALMQLRVTTQCRTRKPTAARTNQEATTLQLQVTTTPSIRNITLRLPGLTGPTTLSGQASILTHAGPPVQQKVSPQPRRLQPHPLIAQAVPPHRRGLSPSVAFSARIETTPTTALRSVPILAHQMKDYLPVCHWRRNAQNSWLPHATWPHIPWHSPGPRLLLMSSKRANKATTVNRSRRLALRSGSRTKPAVGTCGKPRNAAGRVARVTSQSPKQ